MITVDEALARIFALCEETGTEEVPLAVAAGRVLAGR
jgi:molybdopterin biosynthesis enzyme